MRIHGTLRVTVALALAAGRAAGPAAGAPAGGRATLRCAPERLVANEEGRWDFTVRFENGSGAGAFGDSLVLVVRPAGARGGAEPIVQKLMLPEVAASVSDGDAFETAIQVNAIAPSAHLELRFHWHATATGPATASCTMTAAGSVLEERYPPSLVRVAGRDVEIRKAPADDARAGGAAVLILPGEGSEAAEWLVQAARLAQRGIACVVATSPAANGDDDFAGPASRAAALAALDTLVRMPGVQAGRVAIWGVSRGGTLALRLALERPDAFRAVVAQSASYDLWATHRAAGARDARAIEAAAGRDSAAWAERSPLLRAAALKPAVLVLHGERDDVFPAGPARAFAQAAAAAGAPVTSRILPQGRHALPAVEALRFLQQQLGTPR